MCSSADLRAAMGLFKVAQAGMKQHFFGGDTQTNHKSRAVLSCPGAASVGRVSCVVLILVVGACGFITILPRFSQDAFGHCFAFQGSCP